MYQKYILKHSGLLENAAKYTIAALLLAIPLYPKFPFIKIPGTFVSIRLEDMLLVISLFLTFLLAVGQLKNVIKDKIVQSFAPFIIVGFVSVISAVFVTQTVAAHIAFLHWARRIEYFIPFFLAYFATRLDKGKNTEFYFKTVLITLVLSFIYGFGQKYFSWPIIITQNEEYAKGVALRWIPGSHINSTFAGHYDLATYLVLVLPLIVTSFFLFKDRISKIVTAVVFFSGLWLLVNSASRISLVSYIIASSVALILIKKYKAILLVFIVSILFIGFSSNLLDRYQRIIEVSLSKFRENRLINLVEPKPAFAQDKNFIKQAEITVNPTPQPVFEDRSTNIRLNVEWPRALRAFKKNPLLGTGYSSITLATDNDYLRLLGEVGLLGFIALGLIFLRIIYEIIRNLPLRKHFSGLELAIIAGYTGSIAGILVNAVFIDVLEASKFAIMFWLITGIILGNIKNRGQNNYNE